MSSELRSGRELARRLTAVEAAGWAELHRALPDELRIRFGTEVRRYGAAVALFTCRADFPPVNRVFGLGLDEPLTPEVLDRIVGDYRTAGVRRLVVHWNPEAVPAEACTWFEERGFRALRRMGIFRRRTDDVPDISTELHIAEIGPERAAEYESVVAPYNGVPPEIAPHVRSTIGLPAWRHYLALDGDRAVAGAALFAGGEIGWCGGAATIPSERGRGAQSALLARRIRDAREMGCSWITAEALEDTPVEGNPSYRNMRRVGFELVSLRGSYLLTLAADERRPTLDPSTAA